MSKAGKGTSVASKLPAIPGADDITGQLRFMCQNAKRVQRLCELTGFEFRGGDRLVQHLEGFDAELVDVEPLEGHPDAMQVLEDPDLRPYLWDLEDGD